MKYLRKALALVLTFCLTFSLAVTAFAAESETDASSEPASDTPVTASAETETEEDPAYVQLTSADVSTLAVTQIEITSADQLVSIFADNSSYTSSDTLELTLADDITLSGSITDCRNPATISIDGNGKTLYGDGSNAMISPSSAANIKLGGLTIKNITIDAQGQQFIVISVNWTVNKSFLTLDNVKLCNLCGTSLTKSGVYCKSSGDNQITINEVTTENCTGVLFAFCQIPVSITNSELNVSSYQGGSNTRVIHMATATSSHWTNMTVKNSELSFEDPTGAQSAQAIRAMNYTTVTLDNCTITGVSNTKANGDIELSGYGENTQSTLTIEDGGLTMDHEDGTTPLIYLTDNCVNLTINGPIEGPVIELDYSSSKGYARITLGSALQSTVNYEFGYSISGMDPIVAQGTATIDENGTVTPKDSYILTDADLEKLVYTDSDCCRVLQMTREEDDENKNIARLYRVDLNTDCSVELLDYDYLNSDGTPVYTSGIADKTVSPEVQVVVESAGKVVSSTHYDVSYSNNQVSASDTVGQEINASVTVTANSKSTDLTGDNDVKVNFIILLEVADKTNLEAVIAEEQAMNLNESDYTPASWSVLQNALAAAQSVDQDAGASQNEVNAATAALTAAIDALVKAADKTALEAAIAEAETYKEADYTPASWSVLQDALTAAEALDADGNAAQGDVDDAAAALTAAINALVKAADKTALEAAIAEAETYKEADYTPASWSALQDALTAAEALDADGNAAQGDVDDATAALNNAIAALVKVADKTALETAIAEAETYKEADYTPASWSVLQDALTAAEVLDADANAAQGDVDDAAAALTAAINALVKAADKTALEAAIAEAETYKEADYTVASWSALQDALTAAEALDADGNAAQGDVDDATAALNNAIAALVKAADKTALEAAIAEAETYKEADYTPASWSVLQDALTAAEALDADGNAAQGDVDNATTALNNAIAALVKAADKTALEAAIAEAETYKEADYTVASWAALQDALKAAKEIDENGNAAQEDVDNAADALNEAIKGLVKGADKTDLEALINQAKGLNEAQYTAESWSAMQAVLATAEETYNNGDASQETVDAAAKSLEAAINYLVLHTHEFEGTVTEATCTTGGYTTYTCSICGATYVSDYTDALGHSYTGIVTEATCTTGGYTTYTCSRCNDSYVSGYTSALGHSYTSVVTNPTCTTGGYTTYTCSRCNDSYVSGYTSALGHSYTSVVTNPTCTTGGYTTYTCSICGDTYVSDYTEALGHSYTGVVTEATCTTGGYTTYTCSVCGDTYVSDYTDALGHSYTSDVTAPTCTTGGYTTYTCSVCSDTYVSDYTSELGHAWDEGVVTTEPTCTEDGVMTYTCTRCETTRTEIIANTGHDYVATDVKEPTCTEAGYTTYTCSRCNDSYVGDYTSELGHAWDEGVVTTEPTCEEEGVMTYTCTRCGATSTVAIAKTAHDYVGVVTDPTCTKAGYTTYTCSVCGAEYVSDYTNALGHQWDDGVVTKEPTATEEGEITYTCTRCGATYTEAIPPTGSEGSNPDSGTEGPGPAVPTGFVQEDGEWHYYDVNGNQVMNGILQDTNKVVDGTDGWFYVVNGRIDFSYTGVSNFSNDYGWWYISAGKVDFSKTSIEPNQYGWWRVVNAKVDFSCNSVEQNDYGWWYVTGGQVQFGYTGVANYANAYGWWYIENGKVDFSKNSVEQNNYGWWYVLGGKVDFSYTGVANYANAYGWWYIENGKVDFSKNSVEQNNYGWWYVTGGKVDFSYTGLASNSYGTWYIRAGKVDFSYNGTYNGRTIAAGKVV